MADEPLIKLQEGGEPSIINYQIPDSTSFFGKAFIDLGIAHKFFRSDIEGGITDIGTDIGEARASPPRLAAEDVAGLEESTLRAAVIKGMKTGFSDARFFPNIKMFTTFIRFVEKQPAKSGAEDSTAINRTKIRCNQFSAIKPPTC